MQDMTDIMDMTDQSQTMRQELIERNNIRDLVHGYCWAVDTGTLEEVMALFDNECDLLLIPGSKRVDFMVPLSEGWGGEKIKTKPWWYD